MSISTLQTIVYYLLTFWLLWSVHQNLTYFFLSQPIDERRHFYSSHWMELLFHKCRCTSVHTLQEVAICHNHFHAFHCHLCHMHRYPQTVQLPSSLDHEIRQSGVAGGARGLDCYWVSDSLEVRSVSANLQGISDLKLKNRRRYNIQLSNHVI